MLNPEQFALANYFIKQKQSGLELPMQLAPHMVPPSLRPKPTVSSERSIVLEFLYLKFGIIIL